MEPDEKIFDSPVQSIANIITKYVKTDGKKGMSWYGRSLLLLTTRGRKTGFLRRTVAIFGEHEDRYIVVAMLSDDGSARRPGWLVNLIEDPEVWVQVAGDKFWAKARLADEDERPELWAFMLKVHAHFAAFQTKLGTDLPIVIIEREG